MPSINRQTIVDDRQQQQQQQTIAAPISNDSNSSVEATEMHLYKYGHHPSISSGPTTEDLLNDSRWPSWPITSGSATITASGESSSFYMQPCPKPYEQLYCFNSGQCYTVLEQRQFVLPFCRCAPNFHGRRCEHIFDANFYGTGGPDLHPMGGGINNAYPSSPSSSSSSSSSASTTVANCFLLALLMISLFLLLRHKFTR